MNPTQKQPPPSAALADLTPADTLRCAARYLELQGWPRATTTPTVETRSRRPASPARSAWPHTATARRPSRRLTRDMRPRPATPRRRPAARRPLIRADPGALELRPDLVTDWNDLAGQTATEVIDACATRPMTTTGRTPPRTTSKPTPNTSTTRNSCRPAPASSSGGLPDEHRLRPADRQRPHRPGPRRRLPGPLRLDPTGSTTPTTPARPSAPVAAPAPTRPRSSARSASPCSAFPAGT